MPTGHDPTRIYKNPISPKNAHKLGASAAWSKVKYQSHHYTSKLSKQGSSISSSKSDLKHDRIIEFGVNGEIFIAYNNIIEVWDWIPSSLELKELESKTSTDLLFDDENNDTLYLVASDFNIKGTILNITPIKCDQLTNTYTTLITSIHQSETIFTLKKIGQMFEQDENSLILPPCVHGLYPFTIKNSSNFIGIATNEGSLTIFDSEKKHPLSLSLDAAIIDDQVMFSISGRFLAYVPNFVEDEVKKTPLIVPETDEHSIYSKILNNLSTTAIDSVLKLSDIQAIKNNLYDISSNTIKNNIKIYLSSLINGFKQNQYVIIYDLVKEKQIGCFQPPNGCSNLSLSTFNSQLVTITQRGDQLYNWDLAKLPKEISLIDIQTRGKTGSIVDEIFWSMANSIEIITRASGSIHSFKNDGLNSSNNWILSNMKCTKLSTIKSSNSSSCLIAHCKDDAIYLIDMITGTCSMNFILPKQPIPKSLLPNFIKLSPVEEIVIRTDSNLPITTNIVNPTTSRSQVKSFDNPLSQIEIETCFITAPLYNHSRVQFGNYDFKNKDELLDDCLGIPTLDQHDQIDSDCELFKKVYKNPGNMIGFKRINFGKGAGVPVFHTGKSECDDDVYDDDVNDDENGYGDGGKRRGKEQELIEAINGVLVVDE